MSIELNWNNNYTNANSGFCLARRDTQNKSLIGGVEIQAKYLALVRWLLTAFSSLRWLKILQEISTFYSSSITTSSLSSYIFQFDWNLTSQLLLAGRNKRPRAGNDLDTLSRRVETFRRWRDPHAGVVSVYNALSLLLLLIVTLLLILFSGPPPAPFPSTTVISAVTMVYDGHAKIQ